MYNRDLVLSELENVVRFPQNFDGNYPTLFDSLVSPMDARLIVHPLITTEIIEHIRHQREWNEYATWDAATTYNTGDRVVFDTDLVYQSLVDNNLNNTPRQSPTEWAEVNSVSLFLELIRSNAVDEVLRDLFQMKKIRGDTKTLLNSLTLLTGNARRSQRIVKQNRLVGFEIQLKLHTNINLVLEQIGLQTDTPQVLPVQLFHSSKLLPLATFNIDASTVQPFDFTWNKLTSNNRLSFESDELDSTGKYFVVYNEADLVGQVFEKNWDPYSRPCRSCGRYAADHWRRYNRFFSMRAISVPDGQFTPGELWDIELTRYNYATNWGLNFKVSTRCDLSDLVINQKDLFAHAIDAKIKLNLVEQMAATIRNNDIKERVAKFAQAELLPEQTGGGGLRKQYEKALKAVDFDVSNLSTLCAPCNNKRSLRYGSISI